MTAEQLFVSGIARFEAAFDYARNAKVAAIEAGVSFIRAKSLCKHGQWEELVQRSSQKISMRQVQRCMEFAVYMLDEARRADPSLTEATLKSAAIKLVMRSPKPFTALLREMKLVTQVGAYDPERHQELEREHRMAAVQIEFRFEEFERHVVALATAPNVEELAASSLSKLEIKLEAALDRIRGLLAATREAPPADLCEPATDIEAEVL